MARRSSGNWQRDTLTGTHVITSKVHMNQNVGLIQVSHASPGMIDPMFRQGEACISAKPLTFIADTSTVPVTKNRSEATYAFIAFYKNWFEAAAHLARSTSRWIKWEAEHE